LFDHRINQLIGDVSQNGLTYLDKFAISNLISAIKKIKRKDIHGIWVEAGTALGGSAMIIASLIDTDQQLHLFDTFTKIPPPNSKDGDDVHKRYKEIIEGRAIGINEDQYYGYIEDLISKVKENFNKFNVDMKNVFFHKGLFKDTMHFNEKIAFAHIDCDWYESVMYCLCEIIPNLQIGGIVIIDDYDHWSGCKLAVDEFINTYKDIYNLKIKHKVRFEIERIK
jgi:asparagine synthase (glutamine-hydrolysing)